MENSDSLQVHCSMMQNCCLIEIKGEISSLNISAFQEEIDAALAGKNSSVVMDLSGMTYISSAGLRVLLKCSKEISAANRRLVLFGLNKFAADVFKVSGFDKIFNVQENKEKAFQAVENS